MNTRSASERLSVPYALSLRALIVQKCVNKKSNKRSDVADIREGERVRAALALRIEIDARDLVDQHVDELRHGLRVLRENTRLLAVLAVGEVFKHLL